MPVKPAEVKVYLHNMTYHIQVVNVENRGVAIYTKSRSRFITSPDDIEREVSEARQWALDEGYLARWGGLVNADKPLPFVPD